MRLIILWLVLILTVAAEFTSPQAAAATEPISLASASFTAEGHLGGYANIIKVADQTAYLAEGHYLSMLDISVLPQMVPLASLPLAGTIQDIAIAGSTAYVGVDNVGLAIVDVSNRQQPRLVVTLPLTGFSSPDDLEVAGAHLYIRTRAQGLRIYDLQDAYAPVLLGQYSANLSGWGTGQDLALFGSTAYAISNAQGFEGVHVIDVSDPSIPRLLRIIPTLPDAMNTNAIAISDGRLYIADSNGLQIFDVSAPAKPFLIGAKFTGTMWNIAVAHQWAYVVNENIELSIIDVSKPDVLPVLATYPLATDGVGGLQFVDARLLIAQVSGGLALVDVSDPAMPLGIAHSYQGGESWDVDVQGSLAYVATTGGLQIVDISDPTRPLIRSVIGQNVVAVKVAGHRAYLAVRARDMYNPTLFSGLQIVDIADPNQPTLLGSIATDNMPWRIDVAGSHVFLGGYEHMLVLDAADPAAILHVNSVNISQANDLEVKGKTVYVATPWGVSLMDRDGTNVREFDFEYGCYATGLDIAGKLIYVATQGCGLIMLNAINPDNPMTWREVGRYADSPYDVRIAGKLAVVSNGLGDGTIQAVDVRESAHPVVIASTSIPSGGVDLELRGNLVVAASQTHGLQIFQRPHR